MLFQRKNKKLNTRKAQKLLQKAEKNGDQALLFKIYREAEDAGIRFAVYQKLVREEKQVCFGGMEWFVLKEEDDCQLLLSKYALKSMTFGNETTQKHYEGEGMYHTVHCSWKQSMIRAFLTKLYLDLPEEDRKLVLPVSTEGNYGSYNILTEVCEGQAKTVDRMFVMSICDYLQYCRTSIALRTSFHSDGTAACCWSRTEGNTFIQHGIWTTTYAAFGPADDLEIIPEKYSPNIVSVRIDKTADIRLAIWIKTVDKSPVA